MAVSDGCMGDGANNNDQKCVLLYLLLLHGVKLNIKLKNNLHGTEKKTDDE